MMKKQLFLLFLLMIVLPELIDAGVASPAKSYPGFIGKIVNEYTAQIAKWLDTFVKTAEYLFAIFVPIEMVLIFGPKMLKGDIELGSIVADLVRLVLIFGFMWYLMHATTQLYSILQGFEQLGADATNGMKLDNVFTMTLKLFDDVWNNIIDTSWSWSGLGAMLILGIMVIVLVIVLFIIIGMALKNEILAILAIFISPIFFAMGVFNITRPWAQSGLLLIIKYSAKYMGAMLVLGLTFSTIKDAMATPFENNPEKMVLLFVVLITWELTKGIEGLIDGMFTGMHNGSGPNFGSASLGAAKVAGKAAAPITGKAVGNTVKSAAGVVGGSMGGAVGGSTNAWKAAGKGGANFFGKVAAGAVGGAGGAVAGGLTSGAKGLVGKSSGVGYKTGKSAGRDATSAAISGSRAGSSPKKLSSQDKGTAGRSGKETTNTAKNSEDKTNMQNPSNNTNFQRRDRENIEKSNTSGVQSANNVSVKSGAELNFSNQSSKNSKSS